MLKIHCVETIRLSVPDYDAERALKCKIAATEVKNKMLDVSRPIRVPCSQSETPNISFLTWSVTAIYHFKI